MFLLPKALVEPSPDALARAAEVRAENDRAATAAASMHPTIRDYRAASGYARHLYPEPIARCVRSELDDWCTQGYRMGISPVVAPLYAQVMADAREAGLA